MAQPEEPAYPAAVGRAELDAMSCSGYHCREPHGPLAFHAACHPSVPAWTWYNDGIIEVHCSECGKPVVRVKVAP